MQLPATGATVAAGALAAAVAAVAAAIRARRVERRIERVEDLAVRIVAVEGDLVTAVERLATPPGPIHGSPRRAE